MKLIACRALLSAFPFEGEKMKSHLANVDILYLTPFDIHAYRRPIFAKRALTQMKVINYVDVSRSNMGRLGRILNNTHNVLEMLESPFFKNRRWSEDYLFSAYYYDFVNYLLLIKKLRPHAVITLNTPLALGAKVLGGDVAVVVDWMDVWTWPWDEINPVDAEAVERAEAVIFWSRPFMDIMTRRLGIRKAIYVPDGVDLRVFDPLRHGDGEGVRRRFGLKDKFLFLYSGGVWRSKGMELQGVKKVLEAFALFSRGLSDSVLVLQIFNYDVQLLKDIKELGIRDRVVLIGKLPSFDDSARQGLFSAADVLVLPASRHPIIYYAERMKSFQYMAAGKSIIAAKTPGAVSALGEAALYAKLDNVQEMADAMHRLYEDQELRATMGERARQRVESQYEWSVLTPKYKNFILQTIS